MVINAVVSIVGNNNNLDFSMFVRLVITMLILLISIVKTFM